MLDLSEAARDAYSLVEMASRMELSEGELRRRLVAAGLPLDVALIRDLQPAKPRAPRAALGMVEEAARRVEAYPPTESDIVRLSLPSDRQSVIILTGDWHLGEAGVDYRRFAKDAQAIAAGHEAYPGQLQVIGMGDFIGGFMKSGTPSSVAQILSPHEQRTAAIEAFDLLRPAVLIEADHDIWHKNQDDENDWVNDFCQDTGTPYAQWGVEASLETGRNWNPKLLARHRMSGSRKANPWRPQLEVHRRYGPAEIVGCAHFHCLPGVQRLSSDRLRDERFWAFQSGTYKFFDEYARKLGVSHGEYGVPAFVIDPQGASITGYTRFEDALQTLGR